jgi:hypothetical protein
MIFAFMLAPVKSAKKGGGRRANFAGHDFSGFETFSRVGKVVA